MSNRPEAEIVKNWPDHWDAPVVTVVAICYCHEKYLPAALDSVLAQETDFPFEVLVHDDASPDGSAAIIREYAARYPRIIRPVLEQENQFSRGAKALLQAVLPGIRGKYIAYLDCDDFWTDSHKLQREVDFLEAHPAYLAVAHNCTVVDENGVATGEPYPECRDEEYTMDHFLRGILPGQLATLLVRDIFTRNAADHPLMMAAPQGPFDRVLVLTLLLNGRVFCLQKAMSAYRHVTDGGASYSATYQFDIRREARFYLSLVLQCKRMGRTGDAVGLLRWLADFLAPFVAAGYVSEEEGEPYLAFCRSAIASLSDRLRGQHKRCPCCGQEVQYTPLRLEEQARLLADGGPILPETMNVDAFRCPVCGSTDGERLLAAALARLAPARAESPALYVAPSPAACQWLSRMDIPWETCGTDTVSLPAGRYGLILCSGLLAQAGDSRRVLRELRRILAPEGAVLLLAPVDLGLSTAGEGPGTGDNPRRYSRRGLEALLAQHFAVQPLGRDFFGQGCFAQAGLTETATVYLLTHPGRCAAFSALPGDAPGPEEDDLARIQEERDALAHQLAAVRHEYDIISNATLWKATKPLRTVLDGVKRLLGLLP